MPKRIKLSNSPPFVVGDESAIDYWDRQDVIDRYTDHLIAYQIDLRPEHVFEAYRICRAASLPVSEELLRFFDFALDPRNTPKKWPGAQHVDDVRIARLATRLMGRPEMDLPSKLTPEVLTALEAVFPGVPISERIKNVRQAWTNRPRLATDQKKLTP